MRAIIASLLVVNSSRSNSDDNPKSSSDGRRATASGKQIRDVLNLQVGSEHVSDTTRRAEAAKMAAVVAETTPVAELSLCGGALRGAAGATLASFCVGANLSELSLAKSDVDMQELGPALMVGCAQLARLDLSDVDLRHPRASELVAGVVKTRRDTLRWLDISGTRLAFDRFYGVLGAMGARSTLIARRLGLGPKNLVQEGSRRNVGAPRTAELVELDLSENAFGDAFVGLYALGRLLGGLRTVRRVTLADILPLNKRKRAPGVARERELQPADLMRNPAMVGRQGRAPGSSAAFESGESDRPPASPRPALGRTASVASNSSSPALQRLARGLLHVTAVDLSCVHARPLGDEVVALLGTLMAQSKRLKRLDVTNQAITDVGLSAISHGLLQNSSLEHIAFDGSGASFSGLQVCLFLGFYA